MKHLAKLFLLAGLVLFMAVSCSNSVDGGGSTSPEEEKSNPVKSADGLLTVTPEKNGLKVYVDLTLEKTEYWRHVSISVQDITGANEGEYWNHPVVADNLPIITDSKRRIELLFPFVKKGNKYRVWLIHQGNQDNEWDAYGETDNDAVIIKAIGGDGEFMVCADEEKSQYWSPNPRIHLSRLSTTLPASVKNDSKGWYIRGEACENGERWAGNPDKYMDFPFDDNNPDIISGIDAMDGDGFSLWGKNNLFFVVKFKVEHSGTTYLQEVFSNYDRFFADCNYIESHPFPVIKIISQKGNNDFVTEPIAAHVKESQMSWGDYSNADVPDPWYEKCEIFVDDVSKGEAEVKVRGNWTTNYLKKSLRIKFAKNNEQNLCGLHNGEAYKNWVLLAGFKDASLLRDAVGLMIYKNCFPGYASDTQLVELEVNGTNMGVYILAEQQEAKRIGLTEPEKGAVNTDIGYLIEFDSYYYTEKEDERFEIDYLGDIKDYAGNKLKDVQNGYTIKSDINGKEQHDFIADYMNKVWKICYEAVYNKRYFKFTSDYSLEEYTPQSANDDDNCESCIEQVIDLESLADMYIFNEFICDPDLYLTSFFMDVDFGPEKDHKLRFEAPWDFDSTMGNKSFAIADTSKENPDKRNMSTIDERFAALCQTDVNCADDRIHANPWMVIFIRTEWFQSIVKDRCEYQLNSAEPETYIKPFIDAMSATENQSIFEYTRQLWGTPADLAELCTASSEAAKQSQKASADYLYGWLSARYGNVNRNISRMKSE